MDIGSFLSDYWRERRIVPQCKSGFLVHFSGFCGDIGNHFGKLLSEIGILLLRRTKMLLMAIARG